LKIGNKKIEAGHSATNVDADDKERLDIKLIQLCYQLQQK